MIYCLDTNICIFALNGKYQSISRKLLSLSPERIAIPSIVKAELLLGAMKSKTREKTTAAVESFTAPFVTLPFADKECVIYAQIRSKLERKGAVIGPNDLLIAAVTIANGAILVTNNTKEFGRVDGLMIEDWTT